jgi:hypothetical protein
MKIIIKKLFTNIYAKLIIAFLFFSTKIIVAQSMNTLPFEHRGCGKRFSSEKRWFLDNFFSK